MPRNGNDDSRHDRSTCVKCKRVFYGVKAFDTHLVCGETEMRGKYVILDDLYVLKGDVTLYHQVRAHMEKVRKGRKAI